MYRIGEIVIIPIGDIVVILHGYRSEKWVRRRFRVLVGDAVYEYPGVHTILDEVQ